MWATFVSARSASRRTGAGHTHSWRRCLRSPDWDPVISSENLSFFPPPDHDVSPPAIQGSKFQREVFNAVLSVPLWPDPGSRLLTVPTETLLSAVRIAGAIRINRPLQKWVFCPTNYWTGGSVNLIKFPPRKEKMSPLSDCSQLLQSTIFISTMLE